MARKQAPSVRFSQELFDRICKRIAAGGDENSLRKICEESGMPDRGTFMDWTKRTPELRAQYDQAYLDRQDTYFDELIDIADTEPDPQRARNRIDARKWAWARMNRKKFGDKIETELTGKNGGPIQIVASPLDEEL
jgi:hypothetical protein